MAKEKTAFVCENCGYDSPKWQGRCPSCGEWNSFKEIKVLDQKAAPITARAVRTNPLSSSKPLLLEEIDSIDAPRMDMGDEELNRVLGGGLVAGSLTLLGGEPGIGKSTLTLQTILRLPACNVLYVSGEESAHQIKMRADRLSGEQQNPQLSVLCETALETILESIAASKPQLIIIDSIQTMATAAVDSSPGSIVQVRECAGALLRVAKTTAIPIILIGHITKEGTLAGPKILEHIVDTVIQFEGDRQHLYRILRCIKNRFGSTSEIGIYEMAGDGLRTVTNPSELLLSRDHEGLSGVAISSAVEGIRPFLVEAQALVSTAAYGTPQRSATGFDGRRLNMLLAVLERRVGFKLAQKDVFVNIAGGLRVADLAMDLAVIAAILSSNIDMAIEGGWCLAGEVGLSGEVRPVSRLDQRIAEAARLGFKHIIIPDAPHAECDKINIHVVRRVEEALRLLFG